MGEAAPSSTIYATCDTYHKCALFKQPGYFMNQGLKIKMGEYNWLISPYQREKDGKLGVDIVISLQGIKPGEYLSIDFTLQQPGNVKHSFEHTFDEHRCTFFYRRALTVPILNIKNGKINFHYAHDRFLRRTEDDEPEGAEAEHWKATLPWVWDKEGELPVAQDLNQLFERTLYIEEENKQTFTYYFKIDGVQKHKAPQVRKIAWWPKASRTARYLHGRAISVDGNWFSSWPGFKLFLANVDLLTPEDFEDFVDVMGVYYHAWNFDHHRLQALVRAAEKFGFYDFPQTMICLGNVDVYFSSMRSVLFARMTHPIVSSKREVPAKKPQDENFTITHKMIFHVNRSNTHIYRSFRTKQGMAWTTCLQRKTYSGVEYLSVSLMLNGEYDTGESQLWRVDFGPAKQASCMRLPRRSHDRMLNTVQRTICFPTCYLWNDVLKEMGPNGPFNFSLKVSCTPVSGCNYVSVVNNHGVSGMTNGELQCKDGDVIHINKDFLRETCETLHNWVPMQNKPNRMELKELEYEETSHFLDHLYHSSKLYTPETWQKAFKVAQFANCRRVTDQFERAIIRTETKNAQDTFPKGYSLEFLKFNVETREQLQIGLLDDFLDANDEPPSYCDNDPPPEKMF